MKDDVDGRDEAAEVGIAALSAVPVIGGPASAIAKLGWFAWGSRKRRRFDANFEQLMREMAQRQGRQPDDEAWFKERLSDPKVEVAIEKGFDLLLRSRDASARLSICRLYASYVGGVALNWTSFLRYGDFLAAADRYSIQGARAIASGLASTVTSRSPTYANITATNNKGTFIFIIRTSHAESCAVPLDVDIQETFKAMAQLKRAHIGTDAEGGAMGNSGPAVIQFVAEGIDLLLNLRPYLLIDESVEHEVLNILNGSFDNSATLDFLHRHVDGTISGGVDPGELEDAIEALRAAQRIVIETDGSEVVIRLLRTAPERSPSTSS